MRKLAIVWVATLVLVGGAGAQEPPPQVWAVNADGTTGELHLNVGPRGAISGTLLGRPVEGYLAGRRIVLRRTTGAGTELWQGWISTPGQAAPIIAGTYVDPDGRGPYPWFAYRREVATSPGVFRTPTPPPAAAATPPPTRTPAPPASPPMLDGRPDLSGVWRTPSGPLQIRQRGSRLTFILPDREVAGRITGPDTIIAGFAPGCCKGRLEQAFTVIAWDNGTRWYRQR